MDDKKSIYNAVSDNHERKQEMKRWSAEKLHDYIEGLSIREAFDLNETAFAQKPPYTFSEGTAKDAFDHRVAVLKKKRRKFLRQENYHHAKFYRGALELLILRGPKITRKASKGNF